MDSSISKLYSVAQGLTFLTTIEETLGKVSPLLAQLFDLGALRVWLHAPSDQTLACLVSWEQHQSSPHPRPITLSEHPLAAHTLTEGQPLVVPSASIDTHLLGLTSPSAHTQALLLPLRARQTVRGLLALCGSAERRIFTPSDVALAQIVAGSLANAIESALLAEQARGTAVEEERRRLARELHDSVSQSLYSATRTAEILPTLWELDPDQGRAALADLSTFSRTAQAEMRMLLLELRPTAITHTPLHELLETLLVPARAKGNFAIETMLNPVPILPADVQIALYRIAQEALTNVLKHACATQLQVQLVTQSLSDEPRRDQLVLTIADNGRGFDTLDVGGGRLGLTHLHERAVSVGAELVMQSAPQQGTIIIVRWQGDSTS